MSENLKKKYSKAEIEIKLISIFLLFPNLQSEVELQWFEGERGKLLLDFISNWSYSMESIPFALVKEQFTDTPENKKYLKLLNAYYDEYKSNTKETIDKILKNLKVELKYVHHREEMLYLTELSLKQMKTASNAAEFNKYVSAMKEIGYIETGEELESSVHNIDNIFIINNNIKTGIDEIDEIGGINKADLISIVANSGMQKTMFSLWFMLNMLDINPDMYGIYFEKEMSKIEISKRILSYFIRINNNSLVNEGVKEIAAEKWNNIKQEDVLNDLLKRIIIVGPTDFNDANDMSHIIKKYPNSIWILDYFTQLVPANSENYDMYLKDQIAILKSTLHHTKSVGIILSQLKHSANIDARQNKIPTVSDMEYGKMLNQASTFVFSLFNPSVYDADIYPDWFYLIPRKSRNGTLSPMMFKAEPGYCNYRKPTEPYNMSEYIKQYMKGNL